MAEAVPDYEELELRIEPGPGDSYQVLASAHDGSTARGTFTRPFSDVELENFVLKVGVPRARARSKHRSPVMEDARRFGTTLLEAVLQGDVRDIYMAARNAVNEQDRGLRVTLYLTAVPELMEIPWEFVYERGFLAQSIYTPVVRSLDLKTVRPPRKVKLPLRILGVVSSPRGFAELDSREEQRKLEQALETLRSEGLVELSWLERGTLAELERAVSAPEEEHVVHFIGHGAYDERTKTGILVFEDAHGDPHEVTGEDLCALLRDERSLRLAVLNSCEGARNSHVDPFSGVAASLLHCEIPAVIGMQFEITDDAAITFSERLYSALAQGFPVDAALAQARKAIFAAGSEIEFGTPVLFLRGTDARLFEVAPGEARRARESTDPVLAGADFSAHFEQRPAEARPNENLTWVLTIENVGTGRLLDVTARDEDGEALAEPIDLAPGGRAVIRRTEPADKDARHVITISAKDAQGVQLSEQCVFQPRVAGESAPAEQREPAPAEQREPAPVEQREPAPVEQREPVRPRRSAGQNRELFDRNIDTLEGSLYKRQKAALRAAIEGTELLLGMFRCAFPNDIARHVAVILTSERLLWAREHMFSDATVDSVHWRDVASVEAEDPNGIDIQLRDDSSLTLVNLQGAGVRLEDQGIEFTQDGLLAFIRARIADAPPPAETEAWHADLVGKGGRFRALRVTLDQETHDLAYEVGVFKDRILLDGEEIHSIGQVSPQGYEIALTDGERVLRGRLRVALTVGGQGIKSLSLTVGGRLLYKE
jgi:hypothetical protein